MSAQPEGQYIAKIGKKLPDYVTAEKTHNSFRGGIFDMYYESPRGLLWVEYKWIPKMPVRDKTMIVPDMSDLQLQWGLERHTNNIPCAVIVGIGKGRDSQGLWFDNPHVWSTGMSAKQARVVSLTNQGMADKILSSIRREHW